MSLRDRLWATMIIEIADHFQTPLQRGVYRYAGAWLEKTLGLRGFDDIYQGGHLRTAPVVLFLTGSCSP